MYDPRLGSPSVVLYVRYRDPATAIAWLCSVFGAREAIRMTVPESRVGHAELVVDSHVIAVGLSTEPSSGTGPADRNAVRAMTLAFVPDVDAATKRAVELGGFLVDPPTDMPWGLRQSIVSDTEGQGTSGTQRAPTRRPPTRLGSGADRTLDRALAIRLIYFVAQDDP